MTSTLPPTPPAAVSFRTVDGRGVATHLCSERCCAAWWAYEIDANGTQLTAAAQEAA